MRKFFDFNVLSFYGTLPPGLFELCFSLIVPGSKEIGLTGRIF